MKNRKEARAWDDAFDREFFTPEEISESDMRANIITAMIEAREEMGISQRQLEELSGVKQPQIARMERGNADPQLGTLLRVLNAMGKTLAIVPITDRQSSV